MKSVTSILLRLDNSADHKVTREELKLLINHIGYLESVCGRLIRACAENGVRVELPIQGGDTGACDGEKEHAACF